ncbi:MAG: hypothetical protein H0T50_03310, partial [Gemmatimonadales bacterium]|nr:hypothetical protein [Gemmatimonadales bacterium]
HVALGGGLLTSGAYFTGPGNLEVSNGDALAGSLQVSVAVHPSVAVVVATAHARPEGQLTGVPLLGSVAVTGVRLWFADAALRGQVPLGVAATAPVILVQAGAGIAHYAVATSVLGTAVDEQATNFALALGAGLALPITRRLSIEALAKDYIASFKSVRDLEAFGVEGRRAHTLLLLISARLGL